MVLRLNSQQRALKLLRRKLALQNEETPRVLLKGPSGAGKSWILRELVREWKGEALIVSGESALASRSYGAFWKAVSRIGPKLTRKKVVAEGASAAAKTVPVVGSVVAYLTELLSANRSMRRRDRTLYLREEEFDILTHINALNRSKPLLLIADDLQYWDQDSIQLLSLLLSTDLSDIFSIFKDSSWVVALTEGLPSYKDQLKPILTRMPYAVQVESIAVDEIQPVLTHFSFEEQLDDDQLRTIHALAGGHLESLRQLAAYLVSTPRVSNYEDLVCSSEVSTQDFLTTIITRRLIAAGEPGRLTLSALESAAILGKTFSIDELRCTLKPAGLDAGKCVQMARSLGLVSGPERALSFQHELLRRCIIHHSAEKIVEIQVLVARCISLLRPFDYSARAEHLLGAGLREEAIRLRFADLYKRVRNGVQLPDDFKDEVSNDLASVGLASSARAILRGYSLIVERRYSEAITLLEQVENIDHPHLIAERLLLIGVARMQSVVTADRRKALSILRDCTTISHGEKELEMRIKLTLLTGYVHLDAWDEARQLDREISLDLSRLARTDPGARDALGIHRRKSGMLYGAEVAAHRCVKAVEIFGPPGDSDWPPRNPVQYFMATCNLSGNYLVCGQFKAAEKASQLALETWRRLPEVTMPRIEKCVNNATLAGFFAGGLSASEGLAVLNQLRRQTTGGVFSRLIRNNAAVLQALSGDIIGARRELEDLRQGLATDAVEDDFYRYFILSNYASALCLAGDRQRAIDLWEYLADAVPRIPESDRHYLLERHRLLRNAFTDRQLQSPESWDSYLRDHWPDHLGPGWRFFGRGFLLTDTQIWLES